MSDIVRDAIAEMVAEEDRVVDPSTGDLGFGSDISCDTDVDQYWREVDPMSTLALGQALIRRLGTPRGSLPDDDDYGRDVRGMLNRATTAADIASLEGDIRTECQKDDRVFDVSVDASVVWGPPTSLSIVLAVTPVDPTISAFSLTFVVDSDGISGVSISDGLAAVAVVGSLTDG